MITSNLDEIRLKALKAMQKEDETENTGEFKNTILSALSNAGASENKTDALTFENIQGITLEQIDKLFKDEDSKNMAKNLRLATLFTSDPILSRAMFDTVLGKPFEMGHSFLFNRYEDKHNFLSSNGLGLTNLLHNFATNQIDSENKNVLETISPNRIGEFMSAYNSLTFVNMMFDTSKKQYDRYKDEDNDYTFFYKNYALEYGQLLDRFKKMEEETKQFISQL